MATVKKADAPKSVKKDAAQAKRGSKVKRESKAESERKVKFTKKTVQTALEKAKGSKTVASRLLNCARSTLDRYLRKNQSLAEVYSDLLNGHLDEIESTVFTEAKKGNMTAATFVLRTLGRERGYVEFKPQHVTTSPHGEAKEILTRLRDGEISVSDAALELEIAGCPVPETIRTLLAKEDRQPPDPSAGQYSSISDEEFERRAAARRAEISRQKDDLEGRRAEIKKLRDEASDSFAPEQAGEIGNG